MAEIRVAVLGGFRSGKTSVIACMDKIIENLSVIDKKFTMTRGDSPSFSELDDKYEEMKAVFQGNGVHFIETEIHNPTSTVTEYGYSLYYNQKRLGMDLIITEVPAHCFRDLGGMREARRIVDASQIVMVVVDTPALVEQENTSTGIGRYHKRRNWGEYTSDRLQQCVLDSMKAVPERRLLLLVPAKCEKYVHEERQEEINKRIKLAYMQAWDGARDMYSCAVVPVLTMGNVDFEEFRADGLDSVHKIRDIRMLNTQWADLLMRMIVQYILSSCLYYLDNPKAAKRILGRKAAFGANEPTLIRLKKENGALINQAVDRNGIGAYEYQYDMANLQIRRKLSDFNVLMFGPQRAGKSSILASMIYSFYQLDWKQMNNLRLEEGDIFTQKYLESKREELAVSFEKARERMLSLSMTEAATDATNNYVFNLNYGSGNKTLTIDFMDIMGERVSDCSEEWDDWLKGELCNCQIIIIAIDTPHLVEKGGRYNAAFNRPAKIFDLIKSAWKDNKNLSRLVLMVPIKCEKYYHEHRMDEVKEAIRQEYKKLLHFLKKCEKTTVAITPILTMGGIVFDNFGSGMAHEVKKLLGRPREVNYKLLDENAQFSPRFCEQPMIYLLSFILKNTKKESLSLLDILLDPLQALKRLKNLWKGLREDEELQKTAAQARNFLKTDSDGYEFIQNPL